ncbi:IS701 family transposase [Calothrix sp. NIES-2098]|uniref:IS701 family transposase n=1 Tax=Calothrix sp. NIES-2098 TaxID=1954171 RepID=UPI000B5E9940|nr:putative transposase [Calothrix sp. NIES-2098]
MVTPRRQAASTVAFIDNYCQHYDSLFEDVRNFEAFKYLHLGMLSEIRNKSLPEIAKIAELKDGQSLHHFLRDALWDVKKLREIRLWLTKILIGEREIILCIDETGDKKKGKATDYVTRQYIGNLGKTENGIVSVNAYGVVDGITYPLMFKIFKPKNRMKSGDEYKSKPQIAIEIIQELKEWGFKIKLVLADSLYGESGAVISYLEKLELEFIVAIRSWADFRLTDYASIERWWEIIFSAYLLVSIQASYFQFHQQSSTTSTVGVSTCTDSNLAVYSKHPYWESGTTWKSALNNLRLIIQPYIFYCLIQPWLTVFNIPGMKRCFLKLIGFMNDFRASPISFPIAS